VIPVLAHFRCRRHGYQRITLTGDRYSGLDQRPTSMLTR
jgi:hypothetical protein